MRRTPIPRPHLLGVLAGLLCACNGASEADPEPASADVDPTEPPIAEAQDRPRSVVDLAETSGIDPIPGGERTRAMVAADFDGDGLDDLFVGNPGDRSYILRNTSSPGAPSFEVAQVLSEGHLSWTAAAADFDNDGDVDLMVGGGGNECQDVDQLWKNLLVETGELSFADVRLEMGLTMEAVGLPEIADHVATTGVRWVDIDLDGWLDLYVTHNRRPRCGGSPRGTESNEVWKNDGGRGFTNMSKRAGLGHGGDSTRHPSVLDYDGDGDFDLFDANLKGPNVLLHNNLVETGEPTFGFLDSDATGVDLSEPYRSFASCAVDVDQDGRDDLLIAHRPTTECGVADATDSTDDETYTPVGRQHVLYRNVGDGTFEDATDRAHLPVLVHDLTLGVMGFQVGDINGDGAPDVFVGNGGPDGIAPDDLFLGSIGEVGFRDISEFVRYADGGDYRTHGSVFMDVDGDNIPELVVGQGGPQSLEDMEEPNRILSFSWDHPADYLKLRLRGDGEHVNRDAIGARAELVFTLEDGATRSLFDTVRGGSCFSADNGRALYFGLGRGASGLEAGQPTLLRIRWPDGTVQEQALSLGEGSSGIVVDYAGD